MMRVATRGSPTLFCFYRIGLPDKAFYILTLTAILELFSLSRKTFHFSSHLVPSFKYKLKLFSGKLYKQKQYSSQPGIKRREPKDRKEC